MAVERETDPIHRETMHSLCQVDTSDPRELQSQPLKVLWPFELDLGRYVTYNMSLNVCYTG